MHQNHITWNSNYILGIEDIDSQHQFFVHLINRISDVLLVADTYDYAGALISELGAYAQFHFISEQNMMDHAEYPAANEHKLLHAELIDQFSAKQGMLTLEATKQRSEALIEFLVQWFLEHTIKEDRLFAEYLQREKP